MSEKGRSYRPTGEPWTVFTERSNEAPRRGLGEDDLQATLRHLKRRGDKTATVERETEGGLTRSTLPL